VLRVVGKGAVLLSLALVVGLTLASPAVAQAQERLIFPAVEDAQALSSRRSGTSR